MIKNKRIKKNWSEEDVLILIWIVSKYADYRGIDHVEKSLVTDILCRLPHAGIKLLPSSPESRAKAACSSGWASRNTICLIITGRRRNLQSFRN